LENWGISPITTGEENGQTYIAMNVTEYIFYQLLQPKFRTGEMKIQTTVKFAVVS
jgi:hypothetical protein